MMAVGMGAVLFEATASMWMALLAVASYAGFFLALLCVRECMNLRRRLDALQVLLLREIDKNKAL